MNHTGKRLVLDPAGQVHIESFEVPAPAADQILVRITCTQVSAGSEMNSVRRRRLATPEERSTFAPTGLGYTAVGMVEAVGDEITGFAPGDRVLCAGNHGTHWLVTPSRASDSVSIPQEYMIEKLPADVSDTEATFSVLGDVALHGVRRAGLQIGESVAVHGLGVVGLLTLQLARLSGAYPLIGVDLVDERLALARELGASHTIHVGHEDPVAAIHSLTEIPWRWRGALPTVPPGSGAEVQFHCTSNIRVYATMLKAAADRGRLIMVGAPPGTVEIEAHELLRRELTVRGSYETGMLDPHPYWPWTRARNRQVILGLIARGQLTVEPLISHVVPYTQAPALYDQMMAGGEGWMSILFTWTEPT